MKIRTYKKSTQSPFIVMRDSLEKENTPDMLDPSIPTRYMNDMVGRFLRTFVRLYSNEELSNNDRDKLRRYLEKIIEAKDAVTPRGL